MIVVENVVEAATDTTLTTRFRRGLKRYDDIMLREFEEKGMIKTKRSTIRPLSCFLFLEQWRVPNFW